MKASNSNYGTDVNYIATEGNVRSAWIGNGPDSTARAFGTSQAAPIVSGIVAIFLSQEVGLPGTEIDKRLDLNADSGYVTGFPDNTRNLFANSGFGKGKPYLKPT